MTDDALAPSPANAAHAWWGRLNDAKAPGPIRADRARLRRLRTQLVAEGGRGFPYAEAWSCASFWDLRRALDAASLQGWRINNEDLALVAALLARVRDDANDKQYFGAALAQRKPSGEPRVAETRFKRIISAETLLELHAPLIAALDIVGAVPVRALAQGLLSWSPRTLLKTRRRWAEQYWTAAFAASSRPEESVA